MQIQSASADGTDLARRLRHRFIHPRFFQIPHPARFARWCNSGRKPACIHLHPSSSFSPFFSPSFAQRRCLNGITHAVSSERRSLISPRFHWTADPWMILARFAGKRRYFSVPSRVSLSRWPSSIVPAPRAECLREITEIYSVVVEGDSRGARFSAIPHCLLCFSFRVLSSHQEGSEVREVLGRWTQRVGREGKFDSDVRLLFAIFIFLRVL